MKPYYEHAGITIYHGDCREVLPDVWFGVDLLLTDPPYGINVVGKSGTIGGSNKGHATEYAPVYDDDKPFDPAHLMVFRRAVMFGANWYADKLPPSGGWIVWDKKCGGASDSFADGELAWTNITNSVRIFPHLWRGMIRASEHGPRYHPTQKPTALYSWILSQWTKAGDLICDPYMGSGPALVAAKDMGRRAIGIEIEERYCEIAAKRLSQEVLPLEQLA